MNTKIDPAIATQFLASAMATCHHCHVTLVVTKAWGHDNRLAVNAHCPACAGVWCFLYNPALLWHVGYAIRRPAWDVPRGQLQTTRPARLPQWKQLMFELEVHHQP